MIDSPSSTLGSAPVPLAPGQDPYTRRQQLFHELLNNSELLLKNRLEVRHLMTPDPVVISPAMYFEEIASLMRQRHVHYLLVCGRGGEVLGVIAEHDLHARQGTTAQQIMDSTIQSIAPDTPLSPAVTYLINENASCVPVVESGRLVGALTTTDLLLTLQCMLQLWMRLTQVLQQDDRWARDLEKIAGGLNGDMAPAELADRIAKARDALQSEIRGLVNAVDLRTDLPTDMPNRVGLEEVLDMLLAMKRRFDRSFSLAVVAIDHFHQIHDSCGAIVTRPLLKVVARWIEDSVRDCDYVARCRNDAFAVVMPEATMQDAEVFCTMLRKMAGANHDLNVKLRISVGAVAPQPGETSDELLQRAEAAVQ